MNEWKKLVIIINNNTNVRNYNVGIQGIINQMAWYNSESETQAGISMSSGKN